MDNNIVSFTVVPLTLWST